MADHFNMLMRVAIFLACITSTSATSAPPPPPFPAPPPPPCEDSGGLSFCNEHVGTLELKIQNCKTEPFAGLCRLSCEKCYLAPPSPPSAPPPPPSPAPPPPPCEDSGGLSYCNEHVGTLELKIQNCKQEPFANLCRLSCAKCYLSSPAMPPSPPPSPSPPPPSPSPPAPSLPPCVVLADCEDDCFADFDTCKSPEGANKKCKKKKKKCKKACAAATPCR